MIRSLTLALPVAVAATFVFVACVNLTQPPWGQANGAGDTGGNTAAAEGGSGGAVAVGPDAASGGSGGSAAGAGAMAGGTAVGGAGGLPMAGGTTAVPTGGIGGTPVAGGTTAAPTGGMTAAPTGGTSAPGAGGAAGNVAQDAGPVAGATSPRDGGIDVPSLADTNRPVDLPVGGTGAGGTSKGGASGIGTGGTGGAIVVDAGALADTALPKDGGIDAPADTSLPPDLGTGGTGGAGTGGTGGTGVDAPIASMIISIDFVGGVVGDAGIAGTVVMSTTEAAGVKPATNWNSAASNAGTLSSLKLADGTTSSASVTWNAAGTWSLYMTDAPGDARMMNGYLDPTATSSPATVAVSGLASPMSSGYDVYVYCYGDIYLVETRTFQYTIGSTTHSVSETGISVHAFPGYTQVMSEGGTGNYVVFHNVTGTSFTLTATPGGSTVTGLHRAPVNGIQIVYPSGS